MQSPYPAQREDLFLPKALKKRIGLLQFGKKKKRGDKGGKRLGYREGRELLKRGGSPMRLSTEKGSLRCKEKEEKMPRYLRRGPKEENLSDFLWKRELFFQEENRLCNSRGRRVKNGDTRGSLEDWGAKKINEKKGNSPLPNRSHAADEKKEKKGGGV